jgi:hypothetical protein
VADAVVKSSKLTFVVLAEVGRVDVWVGECALRCASVNEPVTNEALPGCYFEPR